MYQSVLHARDLALQGASAKEIKTALEDDAYNSSIYLAVNTLEYLKKGGRITPAADVFYNPLSASISVHTGPGAVGIGISFR